MFFANDCILFCWATLKDNIQIQSLWRQYEVAFGQQINMTKTSMCFSPNTLVEVKGGILGLWNAERAMVHDKYLALPSFISCSKRNVFNGIKDRVWKKLQGWKKKTMSKAGKEILIKVFCNPFQHILQVALNYPQACVKIWRS